MENKTLRIGEVIKLGWHSLTSRFGFWAALVGITIAAGVVGGVLIHLITGGVESLMTLPQAVGDTATRSVATVGSLTSGSAGSQEIVSNVRDTATSVHIVVRSFGVSYLISLLIGTFVGLGWTNVVLRTAYGEPTTIRDFFTPMKSGKKFFSLLVAGILYGLIVLAGLILLIFPAAIWGTRYSLFAYFVVRHNMGPIDALRASAATTLNAKLDLFALLVLLFILNVAGVAVFYVGILVTSVLGELTKGQAFKALMSQTKLPPELTTGTSGQ